MIKLWDYNADKLIVELPGDSPIKLTDVQIFYSAKADDPPTLTRLEVMNTTMQVRVVGKKITEVNTIVYVTVHPRG